MASSSSSSSHSSSNSPVLAPLVTHEEFKAFHNIDRILYIRLVLNLDRDPAQSMQVMALLIWLERSSYVCNFIYKLLSFPDTLLNSLVNESVLCLNCIENDQFRIFSPNTTTTTSSNEIPLIYSITKTNLSLQFFHQNRLSIFHAVSKIVNEVCLRAFEDISQQVEKLKAVTEGKKNIPFNFYGRNQGIYSSGFNNNSNNLHGFDQPYNYYYDLSLHKQILNNEIGDLLSHLQICNSDEEKDNNNNIVPADDRTIFLTFSKGYPISEDEVKEFFTRKYGDCIEVIHMQEVLGEDQPLYARLVVYSPYIIQLVLEGKSKAKFSINGKHVWARKYVRKNPTLSSSPPPSSSSSQSQPTSPTATSKA